jgi:UDP-GlcNAc:undecaprenyl-phosphate GlcNAc-1-phosphate transferase
MIYLELFAGFLLAFVVTGLAIPPITRLALARDWVDRPDGHRKLHARPTPTVGGLAIAAGFFAGALVLYLFQEPLAALGKMPPLAFWAGALAMVASGFYDDWRRLGFKGKFVIQVCVAFVLLKAGYRIDLPELSFLPSGALDQALSDPLTIVWIVGVINAVNLIDGLDGLAAGVSLIAFLALSVLFGMEGHLWPIMIGLTISGSLLAFLIKNFNPASIFMGDSGSLLLGYLLAVLSLSAPMHPHPLLALVLPSVVLGLPVLDTTLSIFRRVREGKPICAPDHDHIHHRLVRMWPVRRAVVVLYAVAAAFGGAAILVRVLSPGSAFVILALALLTAAAGVGLLGYLRPAAAPLLGRPYAGEGRIPQDAGGDGMASHLEHEVVLPRAGNG